MAETWDLETGRHTKSIPERKDPNNNMLRNAAAKGKLGGTAQKFNKRRQALQDLMDQM